MTSHECTLLELLQGVSETPLSDDAIVTTTLHLINSGRVQLRGKFARARIVQRSSLHDFLAWVRPTSTSHLARHAREEGNFRESLVGTV